MAFAEDLSVFFDTAGGFAVTATLTPADIVDRSDPRMMTGIIRSNRSSSAAKGTLLPVFLASMRRSSTS